MSKGLTGMKYTNDSSYCVEVDFWDKKMFVYIILRLYFNKVDNVYGKGRKDILWVC